MLVDQSLPLVTEIDRLGSRKRPSAKARLQALGRLKPGQMNKSEAAYARHLEQQKALGIVQWFAFEAMTFKIAPDCRLTPDFMLLDVNGFLCAHDVKGSRKIISDDAKVKMRVAAAQMPIRFFYAFPRKGGGWDVEEVGV